MVSGEWLARAEARQQIRINSHLVYAPGTHAWTALNKQKAFISSVYGIVDCEQQALRHGGETDGPGGWPLGLRPASPPRNLMAFSLLGTRFFSSVKWD